MSATQPALAPPAVALPSPLDFVLEAFDREGALIEREEHGAAALLPERLAAELDVPEECRLAIYPSRRGDVGCGLGSPLLERLIARARGRTATASVQLDIDPPRPGQARSAAERFVLRNGVSEVVQVSLGSAIYLAASVSYVVESDDRREGLVHVALNAHDGGEPDPAMSALLDLVWPSARLRPRAAPLAIDGRAAAWIAVRSERALRAAVEPLLGEVRRRHARDHERIASYFADLVAEARAPRRRADPSAVEAKIAHLVMERDAKLGALGGRFAAKVTSSLAALVGAEVPAAFLQIRLRRRKETREVVLRLPAGAASLDRIACEACAAPTGKPAACDDRMHLLCEACAPNAQGRIACPACAKQR